MKEIHLKLDSGFPYMDTDVSFEQSIEDIKKLLKKFKCDEILTYEKDKTVRMMFKKDGVPYVIDFPVIYIYGSRTQPRLAMEVSGRVIYNEIKSSLVIAEIKSFMQAMLSYIAQPTPDGIISLGELVESQKDKIIKGQLIELDPSKIKRIIG
ncbi:MAG: hypothetical protein MPEBLZ_04353 [Candidatus Methanoperedens nitroreducens]|uniref:Uncharacterized protein n=1 Tax=Candidatus Methanoperedens nitratireducens TaxID=1392998 RepID=A0A0P8CF40_9EURY|nr:hypothetical protein [Candidatus Methanoperedens sp. BLZ2]KAB2942419.1 MAG: hypothetical protein F9K14_17370 [Candidatus Methanoperedens sp.]KPQ41097.1 MAG: hypothetical protein MPEBLZ_04353 [Candidatus Methanoperedens sp. BLZ1]MBZ0176639.1 hypothetical protein [Candidatus Methanoperedens nitroreducens]MCX9080363.1 hypothetical protein [Candidatus Methanoperedens sp.]